VSEVKYYYLNINHTKYLA